MPSRAGSSCATHRRRAACWPAVRWEWWRPPRPHASSQTCAHCRVRSCGGRSGRRRRGSSSEASRPRCWPPSWRLHSSCSAFLRSSPCCARRRRRCTARSRPSRARRWRAASDPSSRSSGTPPSTRRALSRSRPLPSAHWRCRCRRVHRHGPLPSSVGVSLRWLVRSPCLLRTPPPVCPQARRLRSAHRLGDRAAVGRVHGCVSVVAAPAAIAALLAVDVSAVGSTAGGPATALPHGGFATATALRAFALAMALAVASLVLVHRPRGGHALALGAPRLEVDPALAPLLVGEVDSSTAPAGTPSASSRQAGEPPAPGLAAADELAAGRRHGRSPNSYRRRRLVKPLAPSEWQASS